jgi:hypothetical protein
MGIETQGLFHPVKFDNRGEDHEQTVPKEYIQHLLLSQDGGIESTIPEQEIGTLEFGKVAMADEPDGIGGAQGSRQPGAGVLAAGRRSGKPKVDHKNQFAH